MGENIGDRALSLFDAENLSKIEKVRNSTRKSLPSVGIEYKCGTLLMSHSWYKETRLMKKDDMRQIRKLTDEAAATFSGRSSDGQKLIRKLREYAMGDYEQYGEIPDIRYNVEQVSDDIVGVNRDFISRPLGVELLVGGFDENGSALYDIDSDGTVTSWYAYAIGKNQSQMLEILEDSYKYNCSFSEAIELSIKCLCSRNKNLSSQDIQACKIEESGFRKISDSKIEEILVKESDKYE